MQHNTSTKLQSRRSFLRGFAAPSMAVAAVVGMSAIGASTASIASTPEYQKGYHEGKFIGLDHGYTDGYVDAYKKSYSDALRRRGLVPDDYAVGYSKGYEQGYRTGYLTGQSDGGHDGKQDAETWRNDMRKKMQDCMRSNNCS